MSISNNLPLRREVLLAITESKTKFSYIIANLHPKAATIIRNAIMNPDFVEPYETARAELIKRSGELSYQQIRKLLLGDRRPSELLRVMRRREESHRVPDELMLELLQQHLPTRVQSILAAISLLALEKTADSSRLSKGGDVNCGKCLFSFLRQ
ncbi:transposon Tf2-6 polyprotein [Trichonephila inaurata madagascariensis]|uniref:Transposon Tf2-6 polyprotein n=1 Tax=Trichonephila inaurata madagascariensis TaxID=2747483 RepID=A0A8X6X8M7_9ARAC|nr:transposon Tf2-6 polyprotein [Trichonephila inaurata madagascariensis]